MNVNTIDTLPMIGMDNTTALEVIELERMLEDELRCQSNHKNPRSGICLVEVYARRVSCTGSMLVCKNSYENVEALMISSMKCNGCHKLVADCWRQYLV